MVRPFHIALPDDIKKGLTTDVYFVRTKKILKALKMDKLRVTMEVTSGSLPRGWSWTVFCGLDDVLTLLEGIPVDLYSFPEGTVFKPYDMDGLRIPVMVIEGPYGEFCIYETPLLGLVCQASGIATMAARVKKAAGDKVVLGFGIRRMHPALAPMIDRASYIGGVDGVSSIIGAEAIGKKPMGTMPHALIIVLGDQVKAWKSFDQVVEKDVPRIALVDTFYDEKVEAVMAAKALGERLYGVRLDTPGSRKGDFAAIVREVKWELKVRGYENVKIIVSGGLNEENIPALAEAGADGFGVGTSISNAPTVDFAMDIVAVEGKPLAKRGKFSGRKQVWRCPKCLVDYVRLIEEKAPRCRLCGGETKPLLRKYMENGEVLVREGVDEIRERVLSQLEKLSL
ncbi:nicotinate phosphoribosyltransferase [Candidatus Bathyarchaeota archaeon]|nr:nicotinate phosphoribosyltransferase [Candidatus Bathyarchaeota archaeon]